MSTSRKTPVEQKAKLVEQLNDIKLKIEKFDEQRAGKIASLAKRFRLIDLSDAIITKEFKAIRERYKAPMDPKAKHLDPGKKNS